MGDKMDSEFKQGQHHAVAWRVALRALQFLWLCGENNLIQTQYFGI